jgi:DNA-binding CsgD family transcriptional regulator
MVAISRGQRENHSCMEPETRYAKSGGLRIAYQVIGAGPDLVMVPGLTSHLEIGWGALTEAERRVAQLVADGLANREVAERLFLSRYTVETHLKRVFAKLGVSSRAELAALACEIPELRDAGPSAGRHDSWHGRRDR